MHAGTIGMLTLLVLPNSRENFPKLGLAAGVPESPGSAWGRARAAASRGKQRHVPPLACQTLEPRFLPPSAAGVPGRRTERLTKPALDSVGLGAVVGTR